LARISHRVTSSRCHLMTPMSLLSTMTKSEPPLRFALVFIWKTEDGGRARHPFGFLLIQLLLCLMVFLPGGMTLRFVIDPEVSHNSSSIWKSPAIHCRSSSLLQFVVDPEVSCDSLSIWKSPTISQSQHCVVSLIRKSPAICC